MNDLFISGYASRFDEPDLSGDIVRRGAFSASLLSRVDPFPMLFGHRTDAPIGVWDRVVEDEIGLFVAGRVLDSDATTRRLIETRAVNGLSIGYRTRRANFGRSLSSPSRCCALRGLRKLATILKHTHPTQGELRDP